MSARRSPTGIATVFLVACALAHAASAGLPARAHADVKAPAPTCARYCQMVVAGCTGPRAVYADQADCARRCHAEAWDAGREGDEKGDSLGCRLTWAGRAVTDPAGACPHAGPLSPMCMASRSLPLVPPLDPAANAVLGLYDSEDGREWNGGRRCARVILGERLRRVLEKKGLRLILHNVREGLPDAEAVGASRAVVTSFYDASMPDAAAYLLWLAAQMEAGRKVMILNDIGGFKDDRTGEWVPEEVVNLVFERLGVRYRADWTGDGHLLRTVGADEAMFHKGKVPDPAKAAHYYLFEPVDNSLRVHLMVERTDRPGTKSAVVFTGPRGGMALTRYYETIGGDELLDLGRFVEAALEGGP